MTDQTPTSRWAKWYLWLALPLVPLGFYAIDHEWDASVYFQTVTFNYDGTENQTVDRQEGVNRASSSARLALAALGMLGLVIPSYSRFQIRKPLIWALGGYFFWLYCTALWSVDPAHTIYKLIVVGVFLVASLGLSRQLTSGQLVFVFASSCLALLAVGLLAEIVHGTLTFDQDYRFTGTAHPNTQALYGAILCLSSTILVSKKKGFALTVFAIGLFGVGAVALLVSKSRTSMAAAMFGMLAIGWLRSRGTQRWLFVLSGLFAVTIGVLVMTLIGGTNQGKLGDVAALGRGTGDMTTLTGRVPLWEELLHEFREKPLLGYGYLAFWTPDEIEYLGDVFEWEIPHGHNMYIDVLLDGGIVALALFFVLLLTAMLTATKTFSKKQDASAAFFFGLLCFALLHGCTESLFKMFTFPNFMLTTLMFRLARESKPLPGQTESEDEASDQRAQPELVGA